MYLICILINSIQVTFIKLTVNTIVKSLVIFWVIVYRLCYNKCKYNYRYTEKSGVWH